MGAVERLIGRLDFVLTGGAVGPLGIVVRDVDRHHVNNYVACKM